MKMNVELLRLKGDVVLDFSDFEDEEHDEGNGYGRMFEEDEEVDEYF